MHVSDQKLSFLSEKTLKNYYETDPFRNSGLYWRLNPQFLSAPHWPARRHP